jgi:hypothetical protein
LLVGVEPLRHLLVGFVGISAAPVALPNLALELVAGIR